MMLLARCVSISVIPSYLFICVFLCFIYAAAEQLRERRSKISQNKKQKVIIPGKFGLPDQSQMGRNESLTFQDAFIKSCAEDKEDEQLHLKIKNRLKQRCFSRLNSRSSAQDLAEVSSDSSNLFKPEDQGGTLTMASVTNSVATPYACDRVSKNEEDQTDADVGESKSVDIKQNLKIEKDSILSKRNVRLNKSFSASSSQDGSSSSSSDIKDIIPSLDLNTYPPSSTPTDFPTDNLSSSSSMNSEVFNPADEIVAMISKEISIDREWLPSGPQVSSKTRCLIPGSKISSSDYPDGLGNNQTVSKETSGGASIKSAEAQVLYGMHRRISDPENNLTMSLKYTMASTLPGYIVTESEKLVKTLHSAPQVVDNPQNFSSAVTSEETLKPNQGTSGKVLDKHKKNTDTGDLFKPDHGVDHTSVKTGRVRPTESVIGNPIGKPCHSKETSVEQYQSHSASPIAPSNEPNLVFELPFAASITTEVLRSMNSSVYEAVLLNLEHACSTALDKPMCGTFLEKPNIIESFNQVAGFVPVFVSFAKRLDGFKKLSLSVQIELVKSSYVKCSAMYFLTRFEYELQSFYMTMQAEGCSKITTGRSKPDYIISITNFNEIYHSAVDNLKKDTLLILLIMCLNLFSSSETLCQENQDIAYWSQIYLEIIVHYLSVKYPNGEVQLNDIKKFNLLVKEAENSFMKLVGSTEMSALDPMLQEIYGK